MHQQLLLGYGAIAADWHDSFSRTLNVDSPGWNGFSLRLRFPAGVILVSGTKVRLTLKSSVSAGGFSIDGMTIGEAALSGDSYDAVAGTLVPITFGLSPSFTLAANSSLLTDEITFALDETKDYLVAVHFNAASDILGMSSSGCDTWFKLTTNDTATENVTGYTPSLTGELRLVSKIEAYS